MDVHIAFNQWTTDIEHRISNPVSQPKSLLTCNFNGIAPSSDPKAWEKIMRPRTNKDICCHLVRACEDKVPPGMRGES